MNFSKIEIIPGRCGLRVKEKVVFDTKTIVELPILAFHNHGDPKDVKATMRNLNKKVKVGLYGSRLAITGLSESDIAFKVKSIKPLVVDNKLIVIARIRMYDNGYGKMIRRALEDKVMDVYFGGLAPNTMQFNAQNLSVIEVDI